MGIAHSVESAIDMLLATFVTGKSAALCAALVPFAITGATIHLLLMGFAIMRGETGDPVHTFAWKSFRIAFIASLALSVGTYQEIVVEGSDSFVVGLIQAMSGVESVGKLVDQISAPFFVLGEQIWSEAVVGVWPNLSLVVAAGAVGIAVTFIVVVGLGFFLLAKIAFALVMALGPAYLICAMWPATEKYTESWIGQALNYAVLKVLVGCCILMLTDFVSEFASHISAASDAVDLLHSTLALLVACGALMVVMLNLPQLASALSGGASISGIGRTIGRAFVDLINKGGNKSQKPDPGGGSIFPNGKAAKDQGTGPMPPNRQPLFQRNTIEHLRNHKK